MGILNHLFYPWSLLLQVFALIHFFRRRPDTYWLFIIVFLGPLGARVYLCMEALPDIGLVGQSFKMFPRHKRIGELEIVIRDNPAPGNFEELGHLYMDDGKFEQARAAFDRAIAARIDTLDTFYRRGVCALQLGDSAAAVLDLERAVTKEPDYDFHRAAGLLAHAYAQTENKEKAEAFFRQAVALSTASETYLNFADFLSSQGRYAEARQWAQKVLEKRPSMPAYLRRRERPWFRRARALLKKLPA
jgi:hypothetical protein